MALHLTGTDFFQALADGSFEETRPFWDQQLVSETPEVYRAEYLAASLLADAEEGRGGLSLASLRAAALDGSLPGLVRARAAERYDEGYERGVHDADAALILDRLLALHATAGLLRFDPGARSRACLFWAFYEDRERRSQWERRARSLGRLRDAFDHSPAVAAFAAELADAIAAFLESHRLPAPREQARVAGAYLFEEISREPQRFVAGADAAALRDAFVAHLEASAVYRTFADDMRALEGDLPSRYALAAAWLGAFVDKATDPALAARRHALDEAVVLVLTERRLDRDISSAAGEAEVTGLLGQHPRVEGRSMRLRLDEFLARLGAFRTDRAPGFRAFRARRDAVLGAERERLRLSEFQPRVMSAFVRNRLIDEVYLPLIGDNLAKQIGALGEGKRTDLMGMLLLISPPGYGKTTLMEYVASRLGLIFVKVNGPALGHSVSSLDPGEAPNATARQEVEKINLALEMGNNVMLYLDDIQHTNPELLQKFISLCDAQRKIEGVWGGRTRTYDLRGKRFCVCMAGNPYTESGEMFKIPDMLANRADTYNLGDVLKGRDDLFALSYLENSLTSNPVLAPLAGRDPADVQALIRMARGEEVRSDQLSHPYSAVELGEIRAVLQKLLRVQQVLLRVNQQYILSASQNDAFRTEPAFKLQGSYRNMNKLAEKVVPVMNDAELEALVDDHYAGEAQTLTTGAEHNVLKLAELRGTMTEAQKRRWEEIKRGFARVQAMGGSDDDPTTRVIGQLGRVSDRLEDIGSAIAAARQEAASARPDDGGDAKVLERLDEVGRVIAGAVAAARTDGGPREPELLPYLSKLDQTLAALAEAPRGGQVVQTLPPGVHDVLERMVTTIGENLMPLTRSVVRELKRFQVPPESRAMDLLDRTLRDFDALRDLVLALRKIDTRGLGQ
jgi:MoxR-like ATPase